MENRYLNEQVAAKQRSDASRGVYVFSDMNPYVGHPNPLKEGQEMFRKGLLSEAVLALEAEVLKNPENAEGWRLLGIAHAENDDDQQVKSITFDVNQFFHMFWLQILHFASLISNQFPICLEYSVLHYIRIFLL